LQPFETEDELYFRQQGPLPIVPLLTATSKVTKQDEPLAWAYEYEKARVFQTVLGHGDVSIRKAGALIRRGSVWAARQENISFDPPVAITENTVSSGESVDVGRVVESWRTRLASDSDARRVGHGHD
jgi:type 1 glutamine amidotransferase